MVLRRRGRALVRSHILVRMLALAMILSTASSLNTNTVQNQYSDRSTYQTHPPLLEASQQVLLDFHHDDDDHKTKYEAHWMPTTNNKGMPCFSNPGGPPLLLRRCDGIVLYGKEILHEESDATTATLSFPGRALSPSNCQKDSLWDATLVIVPDDKHDLEHEHELDLELDTTTSSQCFVAMNRFRVRDDSNHFFEERWSDRRSKLSHQPGFCGFSLLRKRSHKDDEPCVFQYSTCTIWKSQHYWQQWRNGGGKTSHDANRVANPQRIPMSEWLEGPSSPIFWEGCVLE